MLSLHILVGGTEEPMVGMSVVVLVQWQLHFRFCSHRIITDIYLLAHGTGLTDCCLGLAVLGFKSLWTRLCVGYAFGRTGPGSAQGRPT